MMVYRDHTEKHIVDLIKHDHPDWAENDGLCRKCLEYYQAEMKGTIFKDVPCALRMRKIRTLWSKVGNIFKRGGERSSAGSQQNQ